MKVSLLVVTNRPEFVPWWAWNIRKQTYPVDEVVVASNYHNPAEMLRLIDAEKLPSTFAALPPKASIGALRQSALDLATGDIIMWFDDDDWQWSENVERMITPILQRRAQMVVYPFSHKLAIASAMVYPVEETNEPWLPSTATCAPIAKQCSFLPISRAEDVYWLETARDLAGSQIRWDFTGRFPNMNVMLIMHGRNVYSEEWRQKYEGAPRSHPLRSFSYPNVSQSEWDEALAMLKKTFSVSPP